MNTHAPDLEIFSKLIQINTKECPLSEYFNRFLKLLEYIPVCFAVHFAF